jgi:hypothetical protein
MNPSTIRMPRACLAAAALALSLPLWAQGASASGKASIEANYQRDRAACAAMTVPTDRSNCLRDAGASRAQALRTGPRTASPEELARNAVQRCQRQPAEQKAICERMARGEGNVSGSVEGGGVIRELVTQEQLPPPPPPAPVAPPAMQSVPPMQSVPMPSPMSPPPVTSPPMPSPMSPPPMTSPPPMSPPPVMPPPEPLPPR